jgi:sugar lactone lactonase YvrE
MTQASLVWDCRSRLGEGTVWNAADGSLYFVDIRGREVLAFTPATGAQRRWPVPQMIGWLVPRADGTWLAGFEQGVAALTLDPVVALAWLQRLHAPGSAMRLNDAKADAAGRLWFGTMNDADMTRPDGCLLRWRAGEPPTVVDTGYGVSNGPAMSPDGHTLYHTDTLQRTIHAFDLDADGGLSNKRVWVRFDADEGYPDGMTTDTEGCVWVAHWGGSRVSCRDAAGRVLRTIGVAAPQVTNVAFGGPGLTDLYISTARDGLGATALEHAPAAGGLFVAAGAGRGRPAGIFAG